MAINYELLKTFVAAATAGSFRQAAATRFVTVSAISQQIKTLETQLGLPLFERLGRGVVLSAEGKALFRTLQPAFAQIDAALRDAGEERTAVAGLVRLGSPRAFGEYWLRPRLMPLLEQRPELSLRLEFGVPTVLERRLAEGELDLAVLGRAPRLSGLQAQRIASERFEAVASAKYLKRWGQPRSVSEFREHRYAIFDPDLAMHAPWWQAWFGERAALPAHIVAEVASLTELAALAQSGICLCVLPSYLTEPVVSRGQLQVIEPVRAAAARKKARERATNELFLAWPRGVSDSARVRAVREILK